MAAYAAYSVSLLTGSMLRALLLGLGTVAAVALATLAAAALAGLVGFISVRRRGVYFVMLTLAFARIVWTGDTAALAAAGGVVSRHLTLEHA